MAQTKAGIEDIRIPIHYLTRAARECQELEILAAGSQYATLVGYEEVQRKLTNACIPWSFDR